jgi:hypothetical protein
VTADTGANTIDIRTWAEPVYYSGLLKSPPNYEDETAPKGNAITYPKGSMVVRLSNFAIYLFQDDVQSGTNRPVRQLIRVTDTMGVEDVLDDSITVEKSVISENIWDMQISYIGYDDFASADRTTTIESSHHYFAGGTSDVLVDLLADLRNRKIKQIDIEIVTLTNEYGGGGETQTTLPQLGDRSSTDALPEGKFGVKVSSFTVQPRNFNIIL